MIIRESLTFSDNPDTLRLSLIIRRWEGKEEGSVATIRELREETGLSVLELAYEAKVSVPTIYRIEKGVPVSRLHVHRVVNILGNKLGRKLNIQEIENLSVK